MAIAVKFALGDCVEVPDGRIGRVRERIASGWRVRVRRTTSASNQFLVLRANQLRHVPTPKGWMSPAGYRRYLKTTLSKLRVRLRAS
jgi:hypothetical protein